MVNLLRCPHCADERPDTEVNGDMLECKSCGLFSRVDIKVNSSAAPTLDRWEARILEIKKRVKQEPEMATATEVQLRKHYVEDVTFLLNDMGEL